MFGGGGVSGSSTILGSDEGSFSQMCDGVMIFSQHGHSIGLGFEGDVFSTQVSNFVINMIATCVYFWHGTWKTGMELFAFHDSCIHRKCCKCRNFMYMLIKFIGCIFRLGPMMGY